MLNVAGLSGRWLERDSAESLPLAYDWFRDLRERKRRTLLGFVEVGETGGSRFLEFELLLPFSEVLEAGDVESAG